MHVKFIAAIAISLASTCAASAWQPVGDGKQGISIDRERIGHGGGGWVVVWSRVDLPQAVMDREGRYDAIEALNRYDCAEARFATLKRLYLRDATLVRAEPVLAPREVAINAGSTEAVIMAEVCGSIRSPAQAIAKRAGGEGPDPDGMARFITVADAAPKAAEQPATAPAPRRFIVLPRIDPSQVERPIDEPKSADPSAAQREAAKAGVALDAARKGPGRQDREVVLATSGPRRKGDTRPATNKDHHREAHWGYEGEGAPAHWGKLHRDYAQCDSGRRQSPIDIGEGIRVDLEPIRFDYRPSQFRIVDNGHTVQVTPNAGNSITVLGRTWRLVQMHFHHPAEERIDGRGFEMSLHLVHKDDDGRLAVVAVLIERGAEHPLVQTFWNHLPLEQNVELAPSPQIDPATLLPEASNLYYTYMGSLTTPPCSEGVLWMVMKQPIHLSAEQISIFSRLYRNNARPIQQANGRLIKESR